jgi:hypothetical protein
VDQAALVDRKGAPERISDDLAVTKNLSQLRIVHYQTTGEE